ncbi:MAG: VCBS repeat-containing protein [Saprospiraceae bacterium]|nr:VCBS repeat-containing protein [Saprospiraceae bacterium]
MGISDLNQDGWLDMYVSNDFNEQDYLYINTQNGRFKNVIKEATRTYIIVFYGFGHRRY